MTSSTTRPWLADLFLDVEAAKKDLSKVTSRDISVRTPHGRAAVTITRADLDTACSDLYHTTAEIIERVLDASGVARDVIDEVIMVGGSSRIPVLAEQLAQMLGRVTAPGRPRPRRRQGRRPARAPPGRVGSDVRAQRAPRGPPAGGNRLVSGRRSRGLPGGPGVVTPVTPRAVGILIQDSHDPSGERTFISHMVQANTPLPVDTTERRFGTIVANQGSVRIQVYEQSGSVLSPEVEHNRRVLDGELVGLGKLAAGSVIEVTLRIAIDGRLTVVAHEPRSRKELTLEAFVEGVIDSAEAQRLAEMVTRTKVRG